MVKRLCATCLEPVLSEDADILVMSSYGSPKCLCDDCASLFNRAATDRDPDKIVASMDRITKKMSDKNIDDKLTVSTVTRLFEGFAKRAGAIKRGEWDFSRDEEDTNDAEGFEEIPEELRETEEDKALDEREAELVGKVDKVLNWVWAGVLIGVVAFVIWRLFF